MTSATNRRVHVPTTRTSLQCVQRRLEKNWRMDDILLELATSDVGYAGGHIESTRPQRPKSIQRRGSTLRLSDAQASQLLIGSLISGNVLPLTFPVLRVPHFDVRVQSGHHNVSIQLGSLPQSQWNNHATLPV